MRNLPSSKEVPMTHHPRRFFVRLLAATAIGARALAAAIPASAELAPGADRSRQSRRRLGPDRASHADRSSGERARLGRSGAERRRRRRHHRARPVRHHQEAQGRHHTGRRPDTAGCDHHQPGAGHPGSGHTAGADRRRVRDRRRAGRFADPDHRRPGRQAQGGPGRSLLGRRLGRQHRPHPGRADHEGGGRRSVTS